MTYYSVERNGYREVREDVVDAQGRLTTHTRSRTPISRVEGPVAGDGFLSFLAHIWFSILLFCIASLAAIYLVGNLGFLLLLTGSAVAFISFSPRMAWLRRGLRWAWRGTTGFIRDLAWEVRQRF